MRSPRYCKPPTITVDHGTEFHFRSMMFPPFVNRRGDKKRNRSRKRPIVEHLHPLEPESVVAELLPLGSVRRFT